MLSLGCFQIHIDAHSDDSIPDYVSGMPFFRYPNTDAEVRYFMQKNDVFIQVCFDTRLTIPPTTLIQGKGRGPSPKYGVEGTLVSMSVKVSASCVGLYLCVVVNCLFTQV